MYFFWRPYLQFEAPKPDARIHTLHISCMSVEELYDAEENIRGRFHFGMIAVFVTVLPILFACALHAQEQGGATALALRGVMLVCGALGVYGLVVVFRRKTQQLSLISQEQNRRRYDKAGKFC